MQNYRLKNINSFGIDVLAKSFATFQNGYELQQLLKKPGQNKLLILGGGSNLLFTSDFDGLVLKNNIRGIEKTGEDEAYYYVKAGAGENWHQFVMYCIENGYAGVENLSLIPGSVGASPMQNIGAYGVELKDVFHELEAMNIETMETTLFTLRDCEFGYRESVFKHQLRNQFVIMNVTFRLKKQPSLNTSYGAIMQEIEKMNVQELNIKVVSEAVMRIRRAKLPDPAVIGNAGSFFKNPEVGQEKFKDLKSRYPEIVGYEMESGKMKLAAGWLIEKCGWKGYRRGDAGCHAKQALVLVNYGNASGREIYNLSTEILSSVLEKFGVELEREVNIV